MGTGNKTPWWMEPLAVIDLETTGVRTSDRIVQIGIIRVERGEIVRTWESLINPMRTIPYGATRVHGISNAMVRAAPTFDVVKPVLRELLKDAVPVGYNGNRFDKRQLQLEWRPPPGDCPALDPDQVWIDPLKWERKIGGRRKEGYSLTTVAKRRGIEIEGRAHSALTDALITFDLLPVVKGYAPEFLEDLLKEQASSARVSRG